MFNVPAFIESKRQEIADNRRQARYFKAAGIALRFGAPVLLTTGAIEGFALAPPEFRNALFVNILPRLAAMAWLWLDQHVPELWAFLRAISPYPRLTQPLPLLSWLGWIGWSFGLIWLGFRFLERSQNRRNKADKDEENLNNQMPLLMHIQDTQQNQSNRVGDISGDGNTVNQINRIQNVFGKEKKESWWGGPVGLTVIGVVINIISKFLHLT